MTNLLIYPNTYISYPFFKFHSTNSGFFSENMKTSAIIITALILTLHKSLGVPVHSQHEDCANTKCDTQAMLRCLCAPHIHSFTRVFEPAPQLARNESIDVTGCKSGDCTMPTNTIQGASNSDVDNIDKGSHVGGVDQMSFQAKEGALARESGGPGINCWSCSRRRVRCNQLCFPLYQNSRFLSRKLQKDEFMKFEES